MCLNGTDRVSGVNIFFLPTGALDIKPRVNLSLTESKNKQRKNQNVTNKQTTPPDTPRGYLSAHKEVTDAAPKSAHKQTKPNPAATQGLVLQAGAHTPSHGFILFSVSCEPDQYARLPKALALSCVCSKAAVFACGLALR